jgi:hypothetical protein
VLAWIHNSAADRVRRERSTLVHHRIARRLPK